MRTAVLFMLMIGCCGSAALADDALTCTTTIIVETCGDVPVGERKVKITLAEGDRIKAITDADGRIEIQGCEQKISAIKVSGADPLKTNKITVEETTDEAVITTITLNICQA